MKTFWGLIALLFAGPVVVLAQTEALDNYIAEGLKNNIVLEQKNVELDKALNALKEAKTYFLPMVNFIGLYQTGEGGRNIPLPIGDLENPVYSTLNKLTHSNSFPQISNESINFLPQNFYDTKVRTTMPLYNADLTFNKSIHGQQVQLKETEVALYKRILVMDIKVAYYNYLMALSAVKIYSSAAQVVKKNVEVNRSLLRNGKGLLANVLRAESEAEGINAQLSEAQSNVSNAQHYFNFLLNKSPNESIDAAIDTKVAIEAAAPMIVEAKGNVREEVTMNELAQKVDSNLFLMNKRFWLPKFNAFVDLGSQASNWAFNGQSRYYFVGAELDLPLFNWGKNNYKTKQSADDLQEARLQTQYVSSQLALSTSKAKNDLISAYAAYQSAVKQNQAARGYFDLIEKGLQQGVNTQIEFIDARNQMTQSEMAIALNTFKVLQAMAVVERETATYSFKK